MWGTSSTIGGESSDVEKCLFAASDDQRLGIVLNEPTSQHCVLRQFSFFPVHVFRSNNGSYSRRHGPSSQLLTGDVRGSTKLALNSVSEQFPIVLEWQNPVLPLYLLPALANILSSWYAHLHTSQEGHRAAVKQGAIRCISCSNTSAWDVRPGKQTTQLKASTRPMDNAEDKPLKRSLIWNGRSGLQILVRVPATCPSGIWNNARSFRINVAITGDFMKRLLDFASKYCPEKPIEIRQLWLSMLPMSNINYSAYRLHLLDSHSPHRPVNRCGIIKCNHFKATIAKDSFLQIAAVPFT